VGRLLKKFTFALKIINVIDEKQMYNSVYGERKCFQEVELYHIDVSGEF